MRTYVFTVHSTHSHLCLLLVISVIDTLFFKEIIFVYVLSIIVSQIYNMYVFWNFVFFMYWSHFPFSNNEWGLLCVFYFDM